MGRDMKPESTDRTDDLQLLRSSRGVEPVLETRVEEVMERDFVSLPPWFSAAQAAKVLRQTGKSYALFGGQMLAAVTELEAGGAKSAASCATPLGPAVAVEASLGHAWGVMQNHHLGRIAVVLGQVLVGVVTRESLAERLPGRSALRLAA
jgi:CBS domain-containing protein